MTIKFKNFTLKPGNAKDRFDIYATKTVVASKNNPAVKRGQIKEGTEYIAEDEVAYDVRLENAIELIVRLNLAEREELTDLQGYVKEYVKAKNEILAMFK